MTLLDKLPQDVFFSALNCVSPGISIEEHIKKKTKPNQQKKILILTFSQQDCAGGIPKPEVRESLAFSI